MRMLLLGSIAWATCALLDAGACRAQLPPNKRHLPHVRAYDPKTDTFTYRNTSVTPLTHERSEFGNGFYGNRLTQFRYLGPPGTGGLYDALDDYKLLLKLNPEKYKYRPTVNGDR